MKPTLQLRLHQQLALTPQLQQAIKLLQLSSVELEAELREALESNPLLEMDEPGMLSKPSNGDDTASIDPAAQEPSASNGANSAETSSDTSEGFEESNNFEESSRFEDSSEPMDFALERNDYSSHRGSSDDNETFEERDQEQEDLHDHLLWQINVTPLSPRDRAIAVILVDSIDDDGYLHESAEAIQQSLASLYHVALDEIEAVRHRIQHLDPLGIGSRTLSECLLIQIDAFDPAATPGHALAKAIVMEHLELLAKNDRAKLCRQLNASPEELDVAVHLIRSLDPKPGAQINPTPAEFVAPDAYAHKTGGRWVATLSPNCQPKLAINQHYASLIARARRADATYMRGQLQEARWLIKSLQTRAETMLKVASAIVAAQTAFLDYGAEAMRPLVLKEIADEVGMHESTVSRVTTRKYLYTPRGTFEFKYFFSSGVSTVDGGAASSTAVRAMIKKLIGEEKHEHPFSDQALTFELNRRGISVARRTVAKYREALHIPASNERCRL